MTLREELNLLRQQMQEEFLLRPPPEPNVQRNNRVLDRAAIKPNQVKKKVMK